MKNINTKKGFTLIELLVVVSIIALLSSVIVAGLTDARGGAKNAKRNELARQYVTGLGLYHGEYGQYPETSGDNTGRFCLGSGYPGATCYIEGEHDQNVALNTAISEFVPGAPASLETTSAGGLTFWGISYRCLEENCENYALTWIVEGSGSDSECFGGAEKTSLNESGSVSMCVYATNYNLL